MHGLNNDQVSAAAWFVCGVTIDVGSVQHGLGTLATPGSGFITFLAGLSICFFSLIGMIDATARRKKGLGWQPIMEGTQRGKAFLVLGALLAYGLLLSYLGFLVCTFLLIGFLLRVIQPQGWRVVIGGAIFTALAAYGIFEVWLQAQLPRGPWGF